MHAIGSCAALAFVEEQHCEPGRFLLVRRDSPARLYVATASASDEQ
jgi:hypothetical protein